MTEKDTNNSPDMVKLSAVLEVITARPKSFKSENALAEMIRAVNNLRKYDLNPVSDTINNTTVNVIAENSKMREFFENVKEKLG